MSDPARSRRARSGRRRREHRQYRAVDVRHSEFVERIATDTDVKGREIALYLAEASSVEEWSEALGELPVKGGEGFALLVVGDLVDASTDTVADLAEWCIGRDAFWVSVWGAGCERVHDIFDEVAVELSLRPGRTNEPLHVLTTWHDEESLGETIEFFKAWSFASEGKVWGPARVVLVIGTTESTEEVRELVARA